MISILGFNKLSKEEYHLSNTTLLIFIIINFLSYIINNFIDYFVISLLIISSIVDIKTKTVPNIIPVLIVVLSFNLNFAIPSFMDYFSILLLFTLTIISFISESIGMGDIKLFISIYLLKGPIFFNSFLFILSFLMFIIALILLIKSKNRKLSFPLVPLILLSFILTGGFI